MPGMSWDPQQMAKLSVEQKFAGMRARLGTQRQQLDAEKKGLSTLKRALNAFRTALKGFGSSDGIIKNNVTANRDGYVNLKATSKVSKGLYEIRVNETAASEKLSFDKMTDESVKAAQGSMKIKVGDKSMTVDMSKVNSLGELRDQINKQSDNPGVTASLMNINGKYELMMSSNDTGEKNKFSVDATDGSFNQLLQQPVVISRARDAEIIIGGDGSEGNPGRSIKSASNNFKNLIPGVEIDVIQKTKKDESLIINVNSDDKGTTEQLQKFVDAYNKLRDSLNDLTHTGSADDTNSDDDDKNKKDDKKKADRGVMAGDSEVRELINQLNRELRGSFGKKRLSDFGISADKYGKLSINNDKLEKGLRDDPSALDGLFSDKKDGILKTMDKSLDGFLSFSHGTIKARENTWDVKNSQLEKRIKALNLRSDMAYNSYLKKFSEAQSAMDRMQQSMAQYLPNNLWGNS